MGCDPIPVSADAEDFVCGPGPRYCCSIPPASGNSIVAAVVEICMLSDPNLDCTTPTCPLTITGAVDKSGDQCCEFWSDGERYNEGGLANSVFGATEFGRISLIPPDCGECLIVNSAKRTIEKKTNGGEIVPALDHITFPDGEIGTISWLLNTFCFGGCICVSFANYGVCSIPLTGVQVDIKYIEVTS